MSLARPIFIQAMWRTGSTYVWKKFRDDRNYHAYLEPLHEYLARPREEVCAAYGPAATAALRHPPLDQFYFDEYPFTPAGVEYFRKSLSYERYCLGQTEEDEDLRRYIGNLNEYAARHGQRPVLQFNRGLLRAAWLAHNFSSVQVLLLRSPLGVWKSFKRFEARYFQSRICEILGQNRSRPPIKYLTPWLDFPQGVRETDGEESDCYRSFAVKNEDLLYPSFFDFYLLSIVHCMQHADCILDLDEISRNPAVRQAATSRLRELEIEISLADCNLPSYVPDPNDREWLAYEEFSPNFLAGTLPPDISISKEKFEANSPLMGEYFRTLIEKFVERSNAGRQFAIGAAPRLKCEKHLSAIRLFEGRQFEQSAESFGAALAEQQTGEVWNDWATAQNSCRRPHLAELGFRLALRSHPPEPEARGNLGALLFAEGRFRDALPLLEGAELDANRQTRPIISQLVNRARESLGFCPSGAKSPISPAREDKVDSRHQVPGRTESAEVRVAIAPIIARATPPSHQGLVIFLTGLPGAGKSTIANELMEKLRDCDRRAVVLLDGDLVRMFLSSELGFSKEHRDLNIRRIGFVAAQIAHSGGIAICSCIAPYDSVRKEVRAMIEPQEGFFLVHVATPLAVCEQRDPKGLYAKARAGILAQFTGVSDPYEQPCDAEISIDTTKMSPERATQAILSYISRRESQPGHACTAQEGIPVVAL